MIKLAKERNSTTKKGTVSTNSIITCNLDLELYTCTMKMVSTFEL